eukprot:1158714-Pelagomonas_calceolata.AAC.1
MLHSSGPNSQASDRHSGNNACLLRFLKKQHIIMETLASCNKYYPQEPLALAKDELDPHLHAHPHVHSPPHPPTLTPTPTPTQLHLGNGCHLHSNVYAVYGLLTDLQAGAHKDRFDRMWNAHRDLQTGLYGRWKQCMVCLQQQETAQGIQLDLPAGTTTNGTRKQTFLGAASD